MAKPFEWIIDEKTRWSGGKKSFAFFCPQCRTSRQLPLHPSPYHPRAFLQVFLTGLVFTLATWSLWTWKGMLSTLLIWTVYEIYYRLRVRSMMHCESCGFDPFLYLQDIKLARGEMDRFWRDEFSRRNWEYPADASGQEGEDAESETEAEHPDPEPASTKDEA